MDVSLQPCFELQGGKSGSAKVDETVGGSALVGEVGSDDAEDADSLDFDDMDSGELTDMENTGVLVYREKVMATPRDSDDTLACIFFVILHQNRLLSGRRKKALFVSPSPDTASKRAKGIYETPKKCRGEKTGEIFRNLPFSRLLARQRALFIVWIDFDHTTWGITTKPMHTALFSKSSRAILFLNRSLPW